MAIQSFQIDPGAGGVSQAEFDNHTHGYRRIDGIGIDDTYTYADPARETVVDDTETSVGADYAKGAESIGVTVSTSQTSVPT